MAPCDITRTEDVKAIFEKAVSKFGQVDVLINAAGRMNQGAMTGEIDPNVWWEDFVGGIPNPLY